MALQVGLYHSMACFPGCKMENEERKSKRERVGHDQNRPGHHTHSLGPASAYAAQVHLLLSNGALWDGDRLRQTFFRNAKFPLETLYRKDAVSRAPKGLGLKATPELPSAPAHCIPHPPWFAYEDARGTPSFLLLRGGSFHGSHY